MALKSFGDMESPCPFLHVDDDVVIEWIDLGRESTIQLSKDSDVLSRNALSEQGFSLETEAVHYSIGMTRETDEFKNVLDDDSSGDSLKETLRKGRRYVILGRTRVSQSRFLVVTVEALRDEHFFERRSHFIEKPFHD
ncbi:unnamed protein product [Heligmosomoides polygyrus]|uniref:SAWADEE domain-containing protein n=1 Tax=Heligmosomoides polygyrus TaxID=6339 RepID=A0A183FHN4_HELPZ|nr:unnamed protein product [Heligmosomoides polygyrus]